MHYVATGLRGGAKVVFVHGSPGDWRVWAPLLADPELSSRAELIALDRPGYGGSGAGSEETSLAAQARAVEALFDLGPSSAPVILVGHSYGGPVVVKAAAEDSRVRGVVIVAGALDPALERKKWFQYLADLRAARVLMPSRLDVCNREIEALKDQLIAMTPDWARVKVPVVVIQGLADERVPPANADFAERMLPVRPTIERVPGLDHFVPERRPDLIRSAVLELLGGLQAAPASPSRRASKFRGSSTGRPHAPPTHA